jgi:uncharacterized protein HemX
MPVNPSFWEQFGPWAVLAVTSLSAGSLAFWKVYLRMADALDKREAAAEEKDKAHAAALERIAERSNQCIENNTRALTTMAERLTQVEHRVAEIECAEGVKNKP